MIATSGVLLINWNTEAPLARQARREALFRAGDGAGNPARFWGRFRCPPPLANRALGLRARAGGLARGRE